MDEVLSSVDEAMEANEAALKLGVSENTLIEWGKLGRIKIINKNNRTFITKEDLDKFIEDYKVKLVTPEQHGQILNSLISNNNGDNIYIEKISIEKLDGLIGEFRKENDLLSPEEIEKLIQENKS